MTKRTFDNLLGQIGILEMMLTLAGVNQKVLDNLMEDAAKKDYSSHSAYIVTLVDGLQQIAEANEVYEVCGQLKKIREKWNIL